MLLRDWRLSRKLTLAETAGMLGIDGKNPGSTLLRIETGARQPEADLVARIVALAGGHVTESDMHAVRLAWLKEHRPEKFASPLPSPFCEGEAA
ncbi:MAG: helix-turn-helix transcriptional regulator [Mesorhizobium sp.]|nr:helix-turn-helix transcriptional regulator [Mesorhizobium sp.]MBN9243965.1 helix-turn-helix transcriptional regulator [Mesorhizobium sp.]